MRKNITFALALTFLFCVFPASYAHAAPASSAGAVSVIDAESKAVLYEFNADEQANVASTTKIMTALIVLENCGLDEEVKITSDSVGTEGSSIYLTAGETVTVEELLYGLMLESGNDAAVALAIHTSGSVEQFASLMNDKLRELDLHGSHFLNPHGLDEEGHYSTAHDMAVIMAEAMKLESFREITSTKEIVIGKRVLTNHNKLLWSCIGVIGGKTGYTISTGRSLVSCCERDGMRLICVTLNDDNDWEDHTELYDWAFSEFRKVQICGFREEYDQIQVVSGVKDSVGIVYDKGLSLLLRSEDEYDIRIQVPHFVYAGVTEGEKAGTVTCYVNGEVAGAVDLVFGETVEINDENRLTFFEKITRGWINAVKYGISKIGIYSLS